jgi:alpha-L-arabinofuranosidase
MLGTFSDHGVEVFTPWDWRQSWWEVLHLFSRYAGTQRVESRCDAEPTVSAYSSLAASGKGLTVILLNRSAHETASVQIALSGFKPVPGPATTLQLAELPEDRRTFMSDTDNALRRGSAPVGKSGVTVSLPPYSITAVVLGGTVGAG